MILNEQLEYEYGHQRGKRPQSIISRQVCWFYLAAGTPCSESVGLCANNYNEPHVQINNLCTAVRIGN